MFNFQVILTMETPDNSSDVDYELSGCNMSYDMEYIMATKDTCSFWMEGVMLCVTGKKKFFLKSGSLTTQ